MANPQKHLYDHIPSCPGVYFMKNKDDATIYIGKSNNLRARVKSYFMPNASLNFAKRKMVKIVEKIDYIETKSDIEALMLETNLIKQNQPKYNVLMKDGKNLSYIKITDEVIPCLIRTRIKAPLSRGVAWNAGGFVGRGEYFWPYSQYFDTYRYVRFIRKLFKLWNHQKMEKFWPPCIDTYIGLCPGHCTGSPEKIILYRERLAQARDFLLWKQDAVIADLQKKMQEAAQKRAFEEALEYKNTIEQIESTGNKQIVRDAIDGDALITVMLEKYNHVFLSVVEVKNGMIIGVHEYRLANPLEETATILVGQALVQYLSGEETKVLYTDLDLREMPDLEEFLVAQKIKLKQPTRGEKVRILEFAHTNLLNFAYHETMEGLKNATLSKGTMVSLLELLEVQYTGVGIERNINDKSPLRTMHFDCALLKNKKEIVFECFDISHSHGEHTVASKSVLVNGKPDPNRYRKYRIKTLKTGIIDDFASMEEILTRRTLAAIRGEDPWPDLIIIDGGKGQLSHAVEAIRTQIKNEKWIMNNEGSWNNSLSFGEGRGEVWASNKNSNKAPLTRGMVEDRGVVKIWEETSPPIISLAKRIEEVFLPGMSEPILLEKWSPELMILQKIRDEAHRFAINYNRSSREKSYTKTLLDEIPGIGPVARRKILTQVSRVEELASWSFEKSQKSFGKKVAEALQNHGLIGE